MNSSGLLVVFSHGKESGPWGSKIQALARVAREHGAEVLSVDYREDPPGQRHDQDAVGEADRRVEQLQSLRLPEHQQLVLVGSSMGGYVSTVCSTRIPVDGLFLLAPAFYVPGYACQNLATGAKETMIVHGWNDDVIPVENSFRFAKGSECDLHVLNGDHRLNSVLPQVEALFSLFLDRVNQRGPWAASAL